jgi:hypothetical protein
MTDRELCLKEFAKTELIHLSPISWHIWKRAWAACRANSENTEIKTDVKEQS